jgi:hypothetical protein
LLNKQPDRNLITKVIGETLPLYHENFPIILFWNPKCGCTSLIKWFYHQIGHLQNALEYSKWVHEYREQIFERQPNYQKKLHNEILYGKKDRYKLVRNPYKRAVSSYLAALLVPAILEQIAPGRKNGLTFKEFLYRLKEISVEREKVNSHIALQYAKGEELLIPNYIKLEEFNTEIKNIEKRYNLLASPLNDIIKSPHHVSHIMNDSLKESFADTNMLSAVLANSGFPPYQNFYDSVTKQLVNEIYEKDFVMFGYDPDKLI